MQGDDTIDTRLEMFRHQREVLTQQNLLVHCDFRDTILLIRFWTHSRLERARIVISEENKKSEPFSYRKKVRIFIVWCDREDSNLWPSGSEPNALSS